ncbi:MAG: hypothetical protein ACRAVC_26615 [Trichormus sp.]
MSNNDEIIDKLQAIVSQFKITPNSEIDIEQLHQTVSDLETILPQLQFELINARMDSNWEQANKLREAEKECRKALDSVSAAILRSTIIGINQENLNEMQKILDEVQSASKTQRRIDVIIASLRFVRKFFG